MLIKKYLISNNQRTGTATLIDILNSEELQLSSKQWDGNPPPTPGQAGQIDF